MTGRNPEIERVIGYIHEHWNEPLSLAYLADLAGYSPFHFARIFKQTTGLSPFYYVSSLRMHRAKELLLRTNLTVRDIALETGHQSLGTFTARFAERVGMPPARYRDSRRQTDDVLHALRMLDNRNDAAAFAGTHSAVEGTVRTDIPFEGLILVGLFPRPIPEGLPLHGTLLRSPGGFRFPNVKPGKYYLMATTVSWEMPAIDVMLPGTTLRARQQVIVHPSVPVPHQDLALRPPLLSDPPILISLPLLLSMYLEQTAENRNL